ncbi:hypothetical protein [Cystobacter ferrugineus]|uniref:Uncharacterized protein n=1 Tax=Cystobacter ferrugineus TaxID=83449 RepID=A0A1L9B130_9BACT|nr:hypothetical protein [Cystobacter ferrugineus]OJH35961.1 hypothetical protein BON30_35740 [Cystobacter ferrugineus]
MKTAGAAHWFFAKIDAIRAGAGHDAAKFEALCKDPALAREASEKFPDDPLLYQQLQAALENEIILARCGIFLTDPPFWDEL